MNCIILYYIRFISLENQDCSLECSVVWKPFFALAADPAHLITKKVVKKVGEFEHVYLVLCDRGLFIFFSVQRCQSLPVAAIISLILCLASHTRISTPMGP